MQEKHIKYLWHIPIFLFIISTFPKHLNEIYLYVPTGKYMQFLEYFILIFLTYITWYLYKKKRLNDESTGFWNGVFKVTPRIYFVFSFLFNLVIGAGFIYAFGLFMDYFYQDYKYKTYEVKVEKIYTGSKKHCGIAVRTNILECSNIKNKTIFHKIVEELEIDKVCTAKSHCTQIISTGRMLSLNVRESPWGIYVYEIP